MYITIFIKNRKEILSKIEIYNTGCNRDKLIFVWVPVDGTNVPYKKWCTIGRSYSDCSDDTSAI